MSGTKVSSILKPFKVAKALVYLKRREKQKKEVKCSKTKAVQNIPSCCLPPEMSLQLVHSQALPAGSWDILTSISLKQQCRGEADALLCISTMREEAQRFKLPPALLLSTVKRSVMKMTAAITSPSCPWDLPCPAEEEKGQWCCVAWSSVGSELSQLSSRVSPAAGPVCALVRHTHATGNE